MRGLRIIAYLFVVGLVAAGSYLQYQSLDKTREKARKSAEALEQKRLERDALRAKVRETESYVTHLQSDPLEVEAAIRDKKKYLRPGEVSIQIKELAGGIHIEEDSFAPTAGVKPAAPADDTAAPLPETDLPQAMTAPPPGAAPIEQPPTGAPTAPGH